MELVNEFQSDVSAGELFALLTDLERVAPCLPGARLDGRDGEAWLGSMRVRIGPVTMNFEGRLEEVEIDRDRRRAVMYATADDRRGGGTAEARVTSVVEERDGTSHVRVETDLQLRGRAAQFGRGAIGKIAQAMFDQFAANLEQAARGGSSPSRAAAPSSDTTTGAPAATGSDALDLTPRPSAPLLWGAGIAAAFVAGLAYGYLIGQVRAGGDRAARADGGR